jgi:hypothetical protein
VPDPGDDQLLLDFDELNDEAPDDAEPFVEPEPAPKNNEVPEP